MPTRRKPWPWLAVSLLAVPAWADAACPADVRALQAEVEAATGAYVQMDPAAFGQARDRAREALGCLTEPIPPSLAAAYHRMEALDGFIARQPERTVVSFRAAVAADPAWTMPDRLAPKGNVLRQQFDEARALPPSATVPVGPPPGAHVTVDGSHLEVRPTERPAILQLVGGGGAAPLTIDGTAWVDVGAVPPEWAAAPAVAIVEATPPVDAVRTPPPPGAPSTATISGRRANPRLPLLVGAGAGAVVSGGLYAGALSARASFDDGETAYEDLDALRGRANSLGYAAQATGLVAIGLGTVAVVVPW